MTVLEYFISLEPYLTKAKKLKFKKFKPSRYFSELPSRRDLEPKTVEEIQATQRMSTMTESELMHTYTELQNYCEEFKYKVANDSLEELGLNLNNLKVLQPVNVRDNYRLARSYILDTANDRIYPDEKCTPEGLEKILMLQIPDKESRDKVLTSLYKNVSIFYDPTLPFGEQKSSEKVFKSQKSEEAIKFCDFNLAQEQPWRFLEPTPPPPKHFIEFMSILFPIEKERLEIYNWLQTAAYAKTQYALILTGTKGTGKGIFSNLCKRIIAGKDSEAYEAPESFTNGSSHFNSELEGARLCIMDEAVLKERLKEKLKRLFNDSGSIEGKGTNAQKNVKLWASFIISNNFSFDNKIEWDDRRFFIPQLSTEKLEVHWDKKKIGVFIDIFTKSDQYICNIMNYIESQIGDLDVKTIPYYTPTFYKLVRSSLEAWQITCLDVPFRGIDAGRKDHFLISELKKTHKNFNKDSGNERDKYFPQNNKALNFFENYRHGPDRIKVADIEHNNKDPKVTYTYEYLKSREKEK